MFVKKKAAWVKSGTTVTSRILEHSPALYIVSRKWELTFYRVGQINWHKLEMIGYILTMRFGKISAVCVIFHTFD